LPATPPKGRWFAISSILIAALGIIPALVYLFNAVECSVPGLYGNSGISMLVLLMCAFGLLVHFIGLLLGIVGAAMGAKAGGFVGIICNVGILVLIVGGALLAAR
jgi:hypothetical protein